MRSNLSSRCVLSGGAFVISLLSAWVSIYTAENTAKRLHAYDMSPNTVSSAAVRQAMLSDPSMLLDTAKLLNQQAIVEKQEASVSLVNAVQEELLKPTPGIIGNPDGKQVVAEFFDYQCIHCRDAAPELLALAAKDHDLKIVLREVPVLGQGSEIAAFAALAAAKQGLYMKMHDALMVAPVPISLEVVDAAAKGIGADVAKLHADMASKDVAAQIEENLSLARRVGMTGTPAFAAPGAGEMDGWSDIHAFESFMAHKSRT